MQYLKTIHVCVDLLIFLGNINQEKNNIGYKDMTANLFTQLKSIKKKTLMALSNNLLFHNIS